MEEPDEEARRTEAGAPSAPFGDGVVAEAVDRIAHQLKNPLQAISVTTEVIRLRTRDTEAEEEVERLGGVVDENVRLLDRRVRMLIAVARRSAEEAPLTLEARRFLRDAMAAFRLDDRERGRGFAVEGLDGEEAWIRVRPGALLALLVALAGRLRGAGERRPRLTVRAGEEALLVEVRGADGLEGAVAVFHQEACRTGASESEVEGGRLLLRFDRVAKGEDGSP